MATYLTSEEEQRIDAIYERVSAAPLELCSIWKIVKPYWDELIRLVLKWPGGKKLAAILEKVGEALDYCCPEDGNSLNEDEQKGLDEAHAALFGAGGAKAAGEKPCCNVWKKVAPYWPIIVSIVARVSKKLAEILRKLGDALEKFCG